MALKTGDVITYERTFTKEDVELFTKVSGDDGIHHTTPDELGRYMIQGLLTATLPTKIGGDNNFLARTATFEFLRPVYTGDTILCTVIIEKAEEQENGRIAISSSFHCTNQHNKEVLKGTFNGFTLPNDQ